MSREGEWFVFTGYNQSTPTGVIVEVQRSSGRYDTASADVIKWDNVIAYRVIGSDTKSTEQAKAPDILAAAAKHMADRAKTYDKPEGERSMDSAVKAFNAIVGRDLRESEGWVLLACLKAVRLFSAPGYHEDSAEDLVSYCALLGEAKAKEKSCS
jgi:hypothetical protein